MKKEGCIWALTALGVMIGMFIFGLAVGYDSGYVKGKRETEKQYESYLDGWSKAFEDQKSYTKEYKRLLDIELSKR